MSIWWLYKNGSLIWWPDELSQSKFVAIEWMHGEWHATKKQNTCTVVLNWVSIHCVNVMTSVKMKLNYYLKHIQKLKYALLVMRWQLTDMSEFASACMRVFTTIHALLQCCNTVALRQELFSENYSAWGLFFKVHAFQNMRCIYESCMRIKCAQNVNVASYILQASNEWSSYSCSFTSFDGA